MNIKKVVCYSASLNNKGPLAHLRLTGPLGKSGITVVNGIENNSILFDRIIEGELVIIQRDFPREFFDYEKIMEISHQEKIPVVFDLDDLLLCLPEDHPDRQSTYYGPSLLPMFQALIEADLVTVSTPKLREYVQKFNKNVAVLPNYFDDGLWQLNPPVLKKPDQNPFTIGYMGGNSHKPDLKYIAPVLIELIKRYPQKINFQFWGVQPPVEIAALAQVHWLPAPTYHYEKFATFFQSQTADIFIAPLTENPFNKCKSPIKFFEYSALGVPGVFSRLETYTDVIIHGYNGLLASSLDEWTNCLTQLIEDEELRFDIAKNAQETIRSNWLLSRNAFRWGETYQKALDHHKVPKREQENSTVSIVKSINLQLFETFIQKETAVQGLSVQLVEKGQMVEALSAQLVEKGQMLEALSAQLVEKGQMVEGLSTQVAEKEQQKITLVEQLREINISKAWQVVMMMRRIRVWLAPPGSRRERVLRIGMRGLRIWRKSGMVVFLRKAISRIWQCGVHVCIQILRRWIWSLYQLARPAGRLIFPRAWQTIIRDWMSQHFGRQLNNAVILPFKKGLSHPDLHPLGFPTAYDVICFPIIEWEHRFQRPQQLATQFAQHGHRVFYLHLTFHNVSLNVEWQQVSERIFQIQLPGPTDHDRFSEPIPRAIQEQFLRVLDVFFAKANIRDAICMVQLPLWTPLALQLRDRYGWQIVYDCMDEHSGLTILQPEMLDEEEKLAQGADLVLTSSQKLWDKHLGKTSRLLMLRNATDFDHFNHPANGRELDHLPRPIIGYYGAIMEWFDAELVSGAAAKRPDWSFVLIGNIDTPSVEPLRFLQNVHFLGEQPYSHLPAYLQQFDVCLIPFKLTKIIQSTNPVKFYEYLSASKPVVATLLPELLPYKEFFYPASNVQEMVANIEQAMNEDSLARKTERVEWARQQTWEARYELLSSAIMDIHGLVSIIIVSFNNLDRIKECLESILEKTHYPRYEVIVVDNDSTPDVIEYLSAIGKHNTRVRVILNNENLGFARANNIGFQAINNESQYVVLLNNDTVVTRGWLSTLVHWLHDPAVGLVGPVTGLNGSANEAAIETNYRDLGEMEVFANQYSTQHRGVCFDIPMLAMYCIAMRRKVFEEIGPLDEQFGVGMFEDDDYTIRILRKGYRVICVEDVFIHHVGRASFSRLNEKAYQRIFDENLRYFESKWNIKWKTQSPRQKNRRKDE